MPVRINEIELRTAGPVNNFKQELDDVTLIYGKNEAGKTTIIENIINCIFKNKRGDSKLLEKRSEDLIGSCKVVIEGIEDKPLIFKPGKTDLDDILMKKKQGLSRSFYNLLLVKGAETKIIDTREGLTRSAVKELVSNQKIYSNIMDKLPNEIGYTQLENGVILGNQQGRNKKISEYEKKLNSLSTLNSKFLEAISNTGIIKLEKNKSILSLKKDEQLKAKRHFAFKIHKKLVENAERINDLKSKGVEELENKVNEYLRIKARRESLSEKIEKSNINSNNKTWIDVAEKQFNKSSKVKSSPINKVLFVLSGIFMFGAGIFLGFKHVLGIVFSLTALFSYISYFILNNVMASKKDILTERRNIQDLKKAFKQRFGRDLNSIADFETEKINLIKKEGELKILNDDLEHIKINHNILSSSIESVFNAINVKIDESKWVEGAKKISHEFNKLVIDNAELKAKKSALYISSDNYLESWDGPEYSSEKLNEIEFEYQKNEKLIYIENDKLENIKTELSVHLGNVRNDNITDLARKVNNKILDYKNIINDYSSEIIAGHFINDVLKEFIIKEDLQMEEYLNHPKISNRIKAVTERYDSIFLKGDDVYIGNELESWPITNLSTGTREQIFIALRMGIAERLSGKESMFLILDDAYQFSDWDRREFLIKQTFQMANSGWQIIYFTMDDDIKKRFIKNSKSLKNGKFKLIEIDK